MTDFEVLKELLVRGVYLSRRGRMGGSSYDDFTHYVLSVGRGDASRHVQIAKDKWDTPAAAHAMRLLLNELTKSPSVKLETSND